MRAFIGLGGNIGEPAVAFRAAVASFGYRPGRPGLLAVRQRAAQLVKQPHFLNAALELETDLSPIDLLAELKRLEQALGRDPQAPRWSPRPIDLDILSFDGMCVTDPEHDIIVPHPRFHERRFALEPVAELDPNLLPWRNCSDLRVDVSVADLLATVANQEVMRVGGPALGRPDLEQPQLAR